MKIGIPGSGQVATALADGFSPTTIRPAGWVHAFTPVALISRKRMAPDHGDEETDGFDEELVHFAAQHGDLDELRRLVAEGRAVDRFDTLGMTPLHYAVKGEHHDVAQFLIEHGADVNAHHEPTISNTPLAEVAATCSLRIARLLVGAGADPTIRGWMQLNALDRAKGRKRGEGREVYELLLRAGRK